MIIDLCTPENKKEQAFYEWINAKTIEEEFSPLHFASFSGNLDAIKTLIKFKANAH